MLKISKNVKNVKKTSKNVKNVKTSKRQKRQKLHVVFWAKNGQKITCSFSHMKSSKKDSLARARLNFQGYTNPPVKMSKIAKNNKKWL